MHDPPGNARTVIINEHGQSFYNAYTNTEDDSTRAANSHSIIQEQQQTTSKDNSKIGKMIACHSIIYKFQLSRHDEKTSMETKGQQKTTAKAGS